MVWHEYPWSQYISQYKSVHCTQISIGIHKVLTITQSHLATMSTKYQLAYTQLSIHIARAIHQHVLLSQAQITNCNELAICTRPAHLREREKVTCCLAYWRTNMHELIRLLTNERSYIITWYPGSLSTNHDLDSKHKYRAESHDLQLEYSLANDGSRLIYYKFVTFPLFFLERKPILDLTPMITQFVDLR